MRVDVACDLDCSAERAWALAQTPKLLQHVLHPLMSVAPVEPSVLPERWPNGGRYTLTIRLFGLVPMAHAILFERVDQEARQIQSREHGRLVRKWDHLVSITPKDPAHCVYRDEIDIDAGVLTLPVWLFAGWLYRHRQRRWLALAKQA